MKKAMTVGLATGIILSLIFIGAGLVRHWIPVTTAGTQWVFLGIFIFLIMATFWVSMSYYSRSVSAKWGKINLTGFVASFIAAFIFSTAAYLYTEHLDPSYLSLMMKQDQKSFVASDLTVSAISGDNKWSWLNSPYNFALSNFKDSMAILLVVGLFIGSMLHLRYKNRKEDDFKNHELIF